MATKGTAWVIRRSTDLVPYLMFMAVRELWAATELAPPPHPADGSAGQPTGTGMTSSLSAYPLIREPGQAPAAAQPSALRLMTRLAAPPVPASALRTPGRRADT